MEHRLAQIQASLPKDRKPLRVMYYEPGGSTGGAGTLFDDMLQALGVINIVADQGITGFRQISSEQLIQWNPDVIMSSADRDALAEARRHLLQDPAVAVTNAGKYQRVIVIPHHLFLTVTHYITHGIEQLARELYDEHS
jgi:iron complex transport system substrate-binding protein